MSPSHSVNTHPNFSFSDGNLILRVRADVEIDQSPDPNPPAESYTYFRVHKAILSDHSDTFSTAFSNIRPDSSLINGCHMLDLHDEVNDVENLLKVIYSRGPRYEKLSQASFNFYEPVLLLAKKYKMNRILETHLPYVIEGWPTDLEDWDLLQRDERTIAERSRRRRSKGDISVPLVDDMFMDPAQMIEFARHFPIALAPILPAVYYQVSSIPANMSNDSPDFAEYLESGGRTTDRSLLLASEYETLLFGTAAMKQHFFAFFMKPKPISLAYCRNSSGQGCGDCYKGEDRYWKEMMCRYVLERLGGSQGLLEVLEGVIQDVDANANAEPRNGNCICSYCRPKISQGLKELRHVMWENLPKFFRIGNDDRSLK